MYLVAHSHEGKCAWLVPSQMSPAGLQQSLQQDTSQLVSPEAAVTRWGGSWPQTRGPPLLLFKHMLTRKQMKAIVCPNVQAVPQTTNKEPSGYVEVFWNALHNHSKPIGVLEITIETGWQLGAGERILDLSLEKMLMCLVQHTELPPFLPPSLVAPGLLGTIPSPFLATRVQWGFPTLWSNTEDSKPFSTKANDTLRLYSK